MPIHLLVDAADIKRRSSVDLLAIELTFLDGLATILLQHELLHQEKRLCRPEDLADHYRNDGSLAGGDKRDAAAYVSPGLITSSEGIADRPVPT